MKVRFYENKRARSESQRWRWQLIARNGNIVADSGEGYAKEAGARKAFESIKAAFVGDKVTELVITAKADAPRKPRARKVTEPTAEATETTEAPAKRRLARASAAA